MAMGNSLSLLVALLLVTFVFSTEEAHKAKPQPCPSPKYPFGDYHNCLEGKLPYRLETLPGLGWDNLRNRISGMVTFMNYSQCRTTEDGQYLIPDNVFVTALKESKASLNSELIDHWSNYSSMTSTTVNVEAHESFFGSISGSFSYENQDIKKRQVIYFGLFGYVNQKEKVAHSA